MVLEKTKILIITSEFPPLPGGIGNHAYMLAKYLGTEAYRVTVLTDYRAKEEDSYFDSQQTFRIVRIKRNYFTYLNRLLFSFQQIRKHDTIIASGKFSLWIVGFLHLFFNSKTFLAVLHGSELRAGNTFQQSFTKYCLFQFDRLIAVSNFTKNVALSISSRFAIDVIPNGIEFNEINKSRNEHLDRLNLVTVGNLTYRKGQQNVLRALPLLKESYPNIHYHCVGIPTELNHFKQLAVDLNVEKNVTFYGAVTNAEKVEILKNCSIFMMLSDVVKNDFEGFGIAILEANAMGLPAIGSKNSGISDAIASFYSGILVDQKHDHEILTAVTTIVESYTEYSRQAQLWSKKFDWNVILKKYIAVIHG